MFACSGYRLSTLEGQPRPNVWGQPPRKPDPTRSLARPGVKNDIVFPADAGAEDKRWSGRS